MEQRMDPQAPAAVSLTTSIKDALLLSRQISQLGVIDYAAQMGDQLSRQVGGAEVLSYEAGERMPEADYLVAAGRISAVAVSFLLGEWEYDEERLDRLEAIARELRGLRRLDC